MNRSPLDILKVYWRYDQFRPMQEEIIDSVLSGKDVLALLPTGGGKSLCYQVPALMKPGLCLVISPLIALMKDQVQQLRSRGITAFSIVSGMSRKEVIATFRLAAHANCKLLYVSPERLETDLFREWLPALDIQLIAVDEAHCISQWGYDFRPPYLRIATLREELPGVPVLALTASATPEIQKDICERLRMTKPAIYRQSFLRPNLAFSVQKSGSAMNTISGLLRRQEGSAIIYCRNRRRTKEISDGLNRQGLSADYYHAGLKTEERSEKQDRWKKDLTRIMVCTNAFGMGIDKPDVRLVLHAGLPDCIESYYQEAGRAGRDGKRAEAVLLYNDEMLDDLRGQHKIQYPPLDYIREVYQAIANYLQVPLGTVGVYYPFDFADFLKRFSFEPRQAGAALKVLAQEDLLTLNDAVFRPATVQFIAEKETLYAFEKENEALEPLIKVLLRTYAGIYDQPTGISEKQMAFLLKWPVEQVTKGLQALHHFGIITHAPPKEDAQIYYNQPRRKSADVQIDQRAYRFRKEQFMKRAKAMLDYVQSDECRSVTICRYFGDATTTPCGICDRCVQKQQSRLTSAAFSNIYQLLVERTKQESIPAAALYDHFSDIPAGQLQKALDLIRAENKLRVDADGFVRVER
ncbi:MAG TPA: ATP-dependent DNA helicase RecQ [Puia sp.]|nr:ATP-dependent DNA helicase RecQ [Puia sp.]